MLQSTIEKILPQLEPLCDLLCVDKHHRNAHFGERDGEPAGTVIVHIGEINMGTEYQMCFNVWGQLTKIAEVHWSMHGDIYHIDATNFVLGSTMERKNDDIYS